MFTLADVMPDFSAVAIAQFLESCLSWSGAQNFVIAYTIERQIYSSEFESRNFKFRGVKYNL